MLTLSMKNFQSIRKSHLDVSGITCIVGSNNSGKTAHIRALRALVLNHSNDDFIHSGSDSFFIGLQFAGKDGKPQEVVYGRKESPLYRINGEAFRKVNRRSLSEVSGRGDFLVMEAGGGKALPQFAFQGEAAFPFSFSEGAVYEVFAGFLGVEALEELLRDRKKQVAFLKDESEKQKRDCERYADSVAQKEAYLKRFPSLDELCKMQARFEGDMQALRIHLRAKEILTALDSARSSLKAQQAKEQELARAHKGLLERWHKFNICMQDYLRAEYAAGCLLDRRKEIAARKARLGALQSFNLDTSVVDRLKLCKEYKASRDFYFKSQKFHLVDKMEPHYWIKVWRTASEYLKERQNLSGVLEEFAENGIRLAGIKAQLVGKACPLCGQVVRV